ncbi:TPA: rhsD element domain protein [Escherichia coli]|nr:rhsD element domain protein [Escherichia coli]EJA0992575.1 rhsD element domain protein [Escherichia coli]EJK2738674.1 rhsD element domain protein [Escherichia coli]HDV3907018.1 rhsD element domain protein [Escherichia coli]
MGSQQFSRCNGWRRSWGHFAYTYVVDVDNPESSTESVGIGAGVDASVMTLACRTWQECWVN